MQPSASLLQRESLPGWLTVGCFDDKPWKSTKNLVHYVRYITDKDISDLDISQGFCPDLRGNQNTAKLDTIGGCTTQSGGHGATCTYPDGFVRTSGATGSGAPGLFAEELQMRNPNAGPAYNYEAGHALVVANPPHAPFINVNQLWESGSPRRAIWAGQCPLFNDPQFFPGNPVGNVCQWLQYLKDNEVQMLISLSPSHDEVESSSTKQRCKDYIHELATSRQLQKCSELVAIETSSVIGSWVKEDVGRTASIFQRAVKFGEFHFTQLYFDGWPDAHGATDPPVPFVGAVHKLIFEASKQDRVAIHCAGGRGRTGTVAVGVASIWQAGEGVGTRTLVENILKFRQRRADIIEHPSQLKLLGVVFNLTSEGAPALNEQVG